MGKTLDEGNPEATSSTTTTELPVSSSFVLPSINGISGQDSFLVTGDLRQLGDQSGSQMKISPTTSSTVTFSHHLLTTNSVTISPHNPRQNSSPDIQDIITGIVKLLNGNVNVHANTQGIRRPTASRINNRGPPRISDVQAVPLDFDTQKTSTSIGNGVTSKRPPPYPFDRPFITGVPIPEQIVPYRPGFVSTRPMWHRNKPRPPISTATLGGRRPIPQYKPLPSPQMLPPQETDTPLTPTAISSYSTFPNADDDSLMIGNGGGGGAGYVSPLPPSMSPIAADLSNDSDFSGEEDFNTPYIEVSEGETGGHSTKVKGNGNESHSGSGSADFEEDIFASRPIAISFKDDPYIKKKVNNIKEKLIDKKKHSTSNENLMNNNGSHDNLDIKSNTYVPSINMQLSPSFVPMAATGQVLHSANAYQEQVIFVTTSRTPILPNSVNVNAIKTNIRTTTGTTLATTSTIAPTSRLGQSSPTSLSAIFDIGLMPETTSVTLLDHIGLDASTQINSKLSSVYHINPTTTQKVASLPTITSNSNSVSTPKNTTTSNSINTSTILNIYNTSGNTVASSSLNTSGTHSVVSNHYKNETKISNSNITGNVISSSSNQILSNASSKVMLEVSSSLDIQTSTISTPNLQGGGGSSSTHQYHPRPGIVLDDPEFQPGGRPRPLRPTFNQTQPYFHHIQPTRHNSGLPPGYGEIFDVTLSAVQGPGSKGSSQQTINIKPYQSSGSSVIDNIDDIIISPSGEGDQFVFLDGKRTYIDLFGNPTDLSQSRDVVSSTQHPATIISNKTYSTMTMLAKNQTLLKENQTKTNSNGNQNGGSTASSGATTNRSIYGVAETEVVDLQTTKRLQNGRPASSTTNTISRPQQQQHHHHHHYRPRPTPPPVRIDTCIVGDDSTCDQAQHERCKTENGVSSCHCRPGLISLLINNND